MSESPDETSLWRELLGRNEFDDRIDTQSDITNLDAFRLLGRCVMLITEVRGLFAAKFLLQLGLVFPVLLLPWMAKIVVDNVILAQPFGMTEVLYPPFMNPILALVQGREPMDIMLILTTIYFVMLVTIGSRFGGTGDSRQMPKNIFGCIWVQIACWFISQQHPGCVGHRSRDSNTLLFTT